MSLAPRLGASNFFLSIKILTLKKKWKESCLDYQVTKSKKRLWWVLSLPSFWSLSLSFLARLHCLSPMSISLVLSPLSIFFVSFHHVSLSCLSPLSVPCCLLTYVRTYVRRGTYLCRPQKQNRGTLEPKRSHAEKRPRAWCQHFWKDRWNWRKVLITAGFLLDLFLCVYMTDSIHNLLSHSSSCVLIFLCRPLLYVCFPAWSTSHTKDENCNSKAVHARTHKHTYNAHTCICVHVGTHTRMNVNSSM